MSGSELVSDNLDVVQHLVSYGKMDPEMNTNTHGVLTSIIRHIHIDCYIFLASVGHSNFIAWLTDLVNSTWNQCWDVHFAVKYLWKGSTKCCGSLYSWEADLANTVTVTKPKNGFGLIEGDTLLDETDRAVESWILTAARYGKTCQP